MAYFKSTNICSIDYKEWEALMQHITDTSIWTDQLIAGCSHKIPHEMSHHMEAKALYVFTMARRLTNAASELGKGHWKRFFVETTSLLFPMIELVGHARLDDRQAKRAYNRDDVPAVANLWAGLRWLRDPHELPQVINNQLKHDPEKVSKWQIGHLIALRHYYLHGSKNAKDRQGNPIPIEDIISYELPGAMIELAETGMRAYWRDLRRDDGNQGWVERLARADIRPLKIEGYQPLEKGLIDCDIVDYLEKR